MKKVHLKRFSRIFLFLMIFELIIPLYGLKEVFAKDIVRVYFDFSSDTVSLQEPKLYATKDDLKSLDNLDLSNFVNGEITSHQITMSNGQVLSSKLSGNLLSLDVKGQKTIVYGIKDTNPGHHIYRLPSGSRWEHKGAKTAIMQFKPDASTFSKGISQYPGLIPSQGYERQADKSDSDKNLVTYPGDLRYDGISGLAPNYNFVGAAVTAAYEAEPPFKFFYDKSKVSKTGGNGDEILFTDKVTNVRITGTKQGEFPDVFAYDWGPSSNPDYGMVKMFRNLDESLIEGIDYVTDAPAGKPEPTAVDRNYYMTIDTIWEGTTNLYKGYIDIEYKKIIPADLTPSDIIPTPACFKEGDTVNFEYTFRNNGQTSIQTPFKVEIRVDGQIIKTDIWDGALSNIGLGRTFDYKFTSATEKSFTISLDSEDIIHEANETNNTINKTFKPQLDCNGNGGPETIKGDFIVESPRLAYGKNNSFKPQKVSVTGGNGCAYQETRWKITQDTKISNGKSYHPESPYGFQGLPYPKAMGIGTVYVTMTIVSTCGTTKDVGPKPFEIYVDSSKPNSPPVFEAGFFERGNNFAIDPLPYLVVDEMYDLRIINNTIKVPNTPYDPEGDPFIYSWDFQGSSSINDWIKKAYEDKGFWEYDEKHSYFTPDMIGPAQINVTAIDYRGASSSQTVNVQVVHPNPVPIISGGDTVIEGRPVKPPISGDQSYSPYRYGKISQYIWENKRDMYPTPGKEIVTLEVIDDRGLKSLNKAVKEITVKPDLPPIPNLEFIDKAIRNVNVNVKNTSSSPDGDVIVENVVTYKYDSNNDGSFAGEKSYPINMANNEFDFNPPKVGKYQFSVFVKEDWGRNATGTFELDVLNESPEAKFAVQGEIPQPPMALPKKISGTEMLTDLWKATNLDGAAPKLWLVNADNNLQTMADPWPTLDGPTSGYNAIDPNTFTIRDANKDDISKDILGPDIKIEIAKDKYQIKSNGKIIKETGNTNDGWTGRYWFVDGGNLKMYKGSAHSGNCTRESPNGGWANYYFIIGVDNISNPNANIGSTYVCIEEDDYYEKDRIAKSVPYDSNPPYTFGAEWIPADQMNKSFMRRNISPTWKVFMNLPSFDGNLAFNKSQTKVAYLTRDNSYGGWDPVPARYLSIRDAITGDLIVSDKPLPRGSALYGFHNDIILILESAASKLYGYDFSGNQIWEYTLKASPPTYNSGSTFNKLVTTKDGVIQFNDAVIRNEGYNSFYDVYFTSINVKTGQVLGSKLIDTLQRNMYDLDSDQFVTAAIQHVSDNKILNEYYLFTREEDDDRYYNRKLKVLEGAAALSAKKEPFKNYGQLSNSNLKATNSEFSYSFRVKDYRVYNPLETTGMSFRMQDDKSFYRLESNRFTTFLTVYQNGKRKVLNQIDYPMDSNKFYSFKVRASEDRIKVYINGVPLIETEDSTFISGAYGLYSSRGNVEFKDLFTVDLPPKSLKNNVTIVNENTIYNVNYTDPENDPKIADLSTWTYNHINPSKFLDIGDGYYGLSNYDKKSLKEPVPIFDRVGEYEITYRTKDDPQPNFLYPSLNFDKYRKFSDPYKEKLIVHRRPIAKFTLRQNPDFTIDWLESSYDPDRYIDENNYSKEGTGIDYRTTRGITDRRYMYVAPDGTIAYGKITRPTQKGVYTVSETVMDEYGAWSDWYEQTINIDQPAPNRPPVAALTFPDGTQSNPSYVDTLTPIIKWNQTDPDPDTTFGAFQILIKNEAGTVVLDSGIRPQGTKATSNQWQLDTALELGKKYQVTVRVSDGIDWSPYSNIGWMVTNRPPEAYMSFPYGTQQAPTVIKEVQPVFQWRQTDPDPGTVFKNFQIQVTNEANDVMILDSGQHSQNTSSTSASWKAAKDLPTGQKLRVRVRVFDGMVWSNWSPQAWFLINRAPTADFTWQPNPVYEGDDITLLNKSSDPDGDKLTYLWTIKAPDGMITNDTSTNGFIPRSKVGTYQVTLTANDPYGASGSITKEIVVNPLIVTGQVKHTDAWNINRTNYNVKMSGDPEQPRAYSVFWAGERFVLTAQTTDTGTATKADSVTVSMDNLYSTPLTADNTKQTAWSGEMYHEDFNSLPDGEYTFVFTARWNNGTVKTDTVKVYIQDNWTDYYRYHRLK
ncbi:CARDB domain-containing protein [Paenibacillus lutrae]|uniref:PKD/Chitinase domain-containing protein n=1 Tax=Paenibacillus lutrae TaxID=2078573 RepID=A0A7X3K1L5_9BACL|nr:CARDB domain-containing protein [Paenibacillus lutrae]MVP02121.1 hypothetical protein [Paenibacillus lutrae]